MLGKGWTTPHFCHLYKKLVTGNLSRGDTKKEPVLTDSKAHNFLAKSVRDYYFNHFRETSLRDKFMYDI